MAAVRSILGGYSSVANLTFTEVHESASVHGDLRLAESDAPPTAWAYYPSTGAYGGDAWFNSARHMYDNPVMGTYAWHALTHELGHALGLKHPHEAYGSFGATPLDQDSVEYSVMSYRSFVGGSTTKGYTNGPADYPQSLMMNDIAALQAMYGANYSYNAGNSVYVWNPNTGEMSIDGDSHGAPAANRIFLTIWDGGGQDAYDFSNYTSDLKVNLQPGKWTIVSTVQLASLGNGNFAAGNIANAKLYNHNDASLIEDATGGTGDDTLVGNAADNHLTGNNGDDYLDGKGGNNTASYAGKAELYAWVDNLDGTWTVSDLRADSPDGTDTVANIQKLKFADETIQIAEIVNHAPVARKDVYGTANNTKLVIRDGVLSNDFDTDGNALSADLINKPGKGRLAFDDDGSFVFRPAKGFAGKVTFRYEASDGDMDSESVRVVIKVGRANDEDAHHHHPKGHTEDPMPFDRHEGYGHGSAHNAEPAGAGAGSTYTDGQLLGF